MNILITGANGFIGQHLINSLSSKHFIYGLVRKEDSKKSNELFEKLIVDLSSPDFSEQLPSNIDCILHLAQSSQYKNFPDGAIDMLNVNIDATGRLLDWARKFGIKQFLYASSANVYGQSIELLTESHQTNPESFYGATKLAAEHLVAQYSNFFQTDILRLFTVYGPKQNRMLVPNIIERIRNGQKITLADGVGIYFTPIFIKDVVKIISRLIDISSKGPYRLLNVCGNNVCHLGELVKVIESILGQVSNVEFTDEEVQYFTGSNERLKSILGKINLTEIETGIRMTIQNHK